MQEDGQSVVEYRVESPDDLVGEGVSAATGRGAVRAVADRLPAPTEPTRTEVTTRRTNGDERVTYELWRPGDADDPGGLLYRGGTPWRPAVDGDEEPFGFGDLSDPDAGNVGAVARAMFSTDEAVVENALDAVSGAADDLSAETVQALSPGLLQRLAMDAGLGDDDAPKQEMVRSSLYAILSLVNAGHKEVAVDGVLELLAVIARSDTNAFPAATTHLASNAVRAVSDAISGTLSMAVADIERALTESPASSALCGSVADGLEGLGMVGRVSQDATGSVSTAFVVGAKQDDEDLRQCTRWAIETQSDASDGFTRGAREALGIFLADGDPEKREWALELLVKHDLRPEGNVEDLRRRIVTIRDETDDDWVKNLSEALLERLPAPADGDSVLEHGTIEESRNLLDTSTVNTLVFFNASATVGGSAVDPGDDVAFHYVTVDPSIVSIDEAGIATVVVPTDSATEDVSAEKKTPISEGDEASDDEDGVAATASSDEGAERAASTESDVPSPDRSKGNDGASNDYEDAPPESIPTVDADGIVASAFTTGEVIGRGGNADIYRADVSTINGLEKVAVKRPRFSGTAEREEIERLLDEAETWDRVDGHAHVTSVVDWGFSDGLPWIAMEYMDGGNLSERLSTEALSLAERAWIALALAKAVAHAHRFGIVHLDLKPANVLFRRVDDGWDVPKVADWGLSRALATHSMTVDGVSPSYAAPEQFDSESYGDIGPETDIYQLGILVYELFTGETPFSGGAAKVLQSTFDETPTPPTERADVPPELDNIAATALAKAQDDRYEHVLYMRDDLQALWESVHE